LGVVKNTKASVLLLACNLEELTLQEMSFTEGIRVLGAPKHAARVC
jgi:hypothetical protein